MKLQEPIALSGLTRTPVGRLGGNLAKFEAYELLKAAFIGSSGLFAAESSKLSAPDQSKVLNSTETDFGAVIEIMGSASSESEEAIKSFLQPDDVIVGNVRNSVGNIARVAALAADFDQSVPAMTVDRQCASSMEALALAAAKINAGLANQILVGGVESASRAPWMFEKTPRPYHYFEPRPYRVRMSTEEAGDPPMGETAEILADEYNITREEMDAFALDSHRKAAASRLQRLQEFSATMGMLFQPKFAFPAEKILSKPEELSIDKLPDDEGIRADSTMEVLGKLRPAFRKENGRVTAGNSSPINDGAAACFALSREQAERKGIKPQAYLTGVTVVGYDPVRMGLGPAVAIPKLLEEHGLTVGDIDLWEINEAFAAQVLAVLKKLDGDGFAIPREKLNVRGGAIALGHPLGATGLRLIATLVYALKERGLHRGVASLCVGGGQGMAVLIENAG